MEKQKKSGMVIRIIRTVLKSLLCILLAVAIFAANSAIGVYERMADSILNGFSIHADNSGIDTTGLDLEYNKCDYTKDTIGAAEDALADQIANEGVVLLQNDGLLPLDKGTAYTLFSVNSVAAKANDSMTGGRDMKALFEAAGVPLNTKMWDYYGKKAKSGYGLGTGSISFGDAEDFSIREVPLSELQGESGLLESAQGTVPVFWLKRVAGEGRDMPRSMYNHADSAEDKTKTYLEPNSTELELLEYLNEHFDNVVLVVNSNAALELGWVKDFPSIKSVLLASGGVEAIPRILCGEVNPSGRTVDTFAADAMGSPAAQNFGDYQYSDESGALTKYNYVTYAEGIYVGYKYYETRYEDVVLNQGNAGDFDYAAEVVYPFGYGLSYTDFDWSDMETRWNGETCTVSVKVTNTGAMAGKEVVEVYLQSPYTDYDRANKVEKAAVQLVGYAKTELLGAGESQTVTVSFDRQQLTAYDAYGAKTYILDAGDYYITAAPNAHAAVNNVLAAKGQAVEGDADFVSLYQVEALDTTTYSVDSYSGVEITNRLDFAAGDARYLTRADWEGTFPAHDGVASSQISTWGGEINSEDGAAYTYTKTADAALLAQLDSFDSLSPVDRSTIAAVPVYNAKNGVKLSQLRGLDYDDPLWDSLLDQLTPEDYRQTISRSGYGVEAIDSVAKPFTIDADTASGLIYGSTGKMYPTAMTLAMTWNQPLAREYGTMIGNEALIGGANGWYAPSMNIHRTPFSGRNGEYYSEDGFLSGCVASNEIYGAANKGMYTFIKHFAFNDQEDHRGDRAGQFSVATWLNEQSAREIYLKPFEMCMKVGDVELNYVQVNGDGTMENATRALSASMGVMTAFNRVGATWTGGCYPLITGILRNEWNFKGFIITDAANDGVFMDPYQMIEAGADAKLTYLTDGMRFDYYDENDAATYYYGREAIHRILYTIANSSAMNGAAPGAGFKEGMRMTQKIMLAVNTLLVLLILWIGYSIFRLYKPSKRMLAKREKKAAKKRAGKTS